MNHSGATGPARGLSLRRSHWIALGGVVLFLALVAGVLVYLSPVLALLDNRPSTAVRGVPAPAKPPPPLGSTQRINVLLLGSDNDQKFQQNACSRRR